MSLRGDPVSPPSRLALPRLQLALAGPLLITVLFLLLVVAVDPLHNFPVSDDWEYARTAQTLLATGQFVRSPLVQATAFFPAVWGALFSAALGATFTALRLSTLPLGLGAVLAFYGALGELGFDSGRRLLGALTLMVSPLFVFFTHSFMTDVPFLFWLLAGLWLSLRALRLERPGLALAGSVCAALAFLTRQLGLALPLALAIVILAQRPRAEWPRWLAASLALPLLTAAAFFAWQSLDRQATWADLSITGVGTLQFLLRPQTPAELARRVVLGAVSLGLYLLPLWLAASPIAGPHAWRALRGRPLLVAGLAVFVLGSAAYFGLRGEWWPYLTDSVTRAGLRPFLAHYGYLAGDRRPPFFPPPVWIGLTLLGALAGAALLGLAAAWAAPALLRRRSPALQLFYLLNLVLMLPTLVFVLVYERYFLALLPGAIGLLLDATRQVRWSRRWAAAGLAVTAAFSIGLMWDYWGWHAVRWTEAQALVARGLPLDQLDAGYEWDGWQLSAEAYRYIQAHGVPMTFNPWEYVIDPRVMLTFTVVPGYRVERTLPFFSPFRLGGADRVYVLVRQGSAPP